MVRPLIITQNITLDGAVEMLDDWFDPLAQDADMLAVNARDSARSDTLVLGRRTFEDFRGFWPEQVDDRSGVTDELNSLDKYVVSSTMTDPGWRNSTILGGDPVTAVHELLDRPGDGEVVVTGSITLCHSLITAGLVDAYRLWTYPYVQGRGRRLFPDAYARGLGLEEHRAFDTGVTYSCWTPRAPRVDDGSTARS